MARNERQLEQLTAYLDGELSDAERAKVEAWLEKDEQARSLLDELRQTAKMVAQLPRVQAPETMADAVAEQIERAALLGDEPTPIPAEPREGGTWRRGLALAASLALVATAGWFMWPELPMAGQVSRDASIIAEAPSDQETSLTPPATENGAKPQPERLALAEKSNSLKPDAADECRRDAPAVLADGDTPESGEAQAPTGSSDRDRHTAVGRGSSVEQRRAAAASPRPDDLTSTPPSVTNEDGTETDRQIAGAGRNKTLLAGAIAPGETRGGRGSPRRSLDDAILTNADIQDLNTRNASNVLVVETDAATQHEIVAYINQFVTDNRIPNARENTFSEPIPPTQRFYLPEGTPLSDRGDAEDAESSEAGRREVCIVLNAPSDEVAELLENVDRIRSSNRAQMNWTANSLPVSADDGPAATMALMKPAASILPPGTPEEPVELGASFLSHDAEQQSKKAAGAVPPDSQQPAQNVSEEHGPTPKGAMKKADTASTPQEDGASPHPAAEAPPVEGSQTGKGEASPKKETETADSPAAPTATTTNERGGAAATHSRQAIESPSRRPGERGVGRWTVETTQPAGTEPAFLQIAMILRTLSDPAVDEAENATSQRVPTQSGVERAGRARSSPTSRPTSQGAPRG